MPPLGEARFVFSTGVRCSVRQKGGDEFVEAIRGFGRAEVTNAIENMKLRVGESIGQGLGIGHRSLVVEFTHDHAAAMV
jgi:hypothetical protein